MRPKNLYGKFKLGVNFFCFFKLFAAVHCSKGISGLGMMNTKHVRSFSTHSILLLHILCVKKIPLTIHA